MNIDSALIGCIAMAFIAIVWWIIEKTGGWK
jgi:hypothetical protein